MRRALSLLFGVTFLLYAAERSPAPVIEEAATPSAEFSTSGVHISNQGASAANANTPLRRYQKIVYDSIGSRWYAHMAEKSGLMALGSVKLSFLVEPTGAIKNLKVIKNSSNEVFANVCLQSILEVKLPPIPEAAATTLPVEGLSQEITFTTLPNSKSPKGPSSKPQPTATQALQSSNNRPTGGQ